jgi:ketosteroid isomerase-like protein
MNHDETLKAILAQEHAALERWYSGDPYGYAELCADDVTYVDLSTQLRLDGIASVTEHMAPLVGVINAPKFEIHNPRLQLHGEVGVFTYTLRSFDAEGAEALPWNASEVYRLDDGQWRVIHAHWSIPEETRGGGGLMEAVASRMQRSGGGG